jgi:hypothetical protein
MAKEKVDHEAEIRSLIKMARLMAAGIENEVDKKVAIGLITDGIFQRKHYHTGRASVEANKLPPKKFATKEHFYGRKRTAKDLIEMLISTPTLSDDFLFSYVRERCQVHSVTKDQNMALRKYTQHNPNTTWEEAYSACKIMLEEKIDRRKKKTG